MDLLIDTNVILDVLLARQPFYSDSAKVLALSDFYDVNEFVSAVTITEAFYICYRSKKDKVSVTNIIKNLLNIVSIADVTAQNIITALNLGWNDFEDCIQYAVADSYNIDGIVTRNPSDYANSIIQIWQPHEILAYLKNN